jgi:hypothetical protein
MKGRKPRERSGAGRLEDGREEFAGVGVFPFGERFLQRARLR